MDNICKRIHDEEDDDDDDVDDDNNNDDDDNDDLKIEDRWGGRYSVFWLTIIITIDHRSSLLRRDTDPSFGVNHI